MEFEVQVGEEQYHFSYINSTSVLVSGRKAEYILYKTKTWRCADELPRETVEELGDVIDKFMQACHQTK